MPKKYTFKAEIKNAGGGGAFVSAIMNPEKGRTK